MLVVKLDILFRTLYKCRRCSEVNSVMETKKNDENKNEPKALDGGWGWFACLGSSLITLSLRSLDPSFGLIFRNLEGSSMSTSIIFSIYDACYNFSGIFVGPLMARYSFRTVAAFGAVLSCTGLMLTSFSNSITQIILTYSILNGIGAGLAVAAAFVCLNTYFYKKRGRAVGFSSAGTALAMMLVPQVAHFLLVRYEFRGTLLIFSAFAMHSIVGACLMRPLVTKEKKNSNIPLLEVTSSPNLDEKIKIQEIKSLLNTEHGDIRKEKKESGMTVDSNDPKYLNRFQKIPKTLKVFFRVDLLKNPSFLNVILGLSLFNAAEVSFKLMMPFFLRTTIGMKEGEIATCLSIMAFMDIVSRIFLSVIFDQLDLKKRHLFWVSALLIAIGRSVMVEQSKGVGLTIILIFNGFIRGAAIQNLSLSVSETCSLKNLPDAYGLFMMSKGIISLVVSPLIGFIRDYTDSYRISFHVISGLNLICFVNWGIEFLWKAGNTKFQRK